ncbi:MAG: type II toxin-antitoxin system mRNA interferase toxin, RelE/StbE family, partial [Patescibacteria group bacterium]
MIIRYSSKFLREYKKLPRTVKLKAEKQEKVFRNDPFEPSLHTHKLQGRLKDFWSFRIDGSHRILFELPNNNKNVVWFHSVGDHAI